MGKTVLKMSFEGKKLAGNWQMYRILIILKKENGTRASSAPALGLNTTMFKHVYWYMQQISGERLQDHWSSGFSYSKYPTFEGYGGSHEGICRISNTASICL